MGLDGATSVRVPLPAYDISKAPPVTDDTPEAQGVRGERILVNRAGACFLAEQVGRDYKVKGSWGPDRTSQLALTSFDPHGKRLGQALFGTVQSRREWFWKEYRTGRALLPDMGIVRTHYEGLAPFGTMVETGDGIVLVVSRRRVGLDGAAHIRWQQQPEQHQAMSSVLGAPAKGGGTLFLTSGPARLELFDDHGTSLQRVRVPDNAELTNSKQWAVVGETTTGDWIMATYPFALEGSARELRWRAAER
jgi:hypothetical protein